MTVQVAAMPVEKATAPAPFSRSATFSSKTLTVGFAVRE